MDIDNLKGEQGGVFLSAGQSYTSTDVADNLVGFIPLVDSSLTSLTMVGFDGTESEIVGEILIAGIPVFGEVSQITVESGLIQGLRHD